MAARGILSAVALSVFRDDLNRVMWVWRALHGDFEVSLVARAAAITAGVAMVMVFGAGCPGGRQVSRSSLTGPGQERCCSITASSPSSATRSGFCGSSPSTSISRWCPGCSGSPRYNWTWRPVTTRRSTWRTCASTRRQPAAEILRRMSGAPAGGRRRTAEAPDGRHVVRRHRRARPTRTPSRDELIAEVSTEQVVKSNLLDGIAAWVILLVWIVVLAVAAILMGWQAFLAALSGVIPVTIAILAQLRRQVVSMMRDADFKLFRTPTGVRISSGMTSTVNRTIHFDRIQGVRLVEPFWWRRFGWARVKLDIAGGEDDFNKGASLIPVADRAVALALIAAVTGAEFDSPQYAGVLGERARSTRSGGGTSRSPSSRRARSPGQGGGGGRRRTCRTREYRASRHVRASSSEGSGSRRCTSTCRRAASGGKPSIGS